MQQLTEWIDRLFQQRRLLLKQQAAWEVLDFPRGDGVTVVRKAITSTGSARRAA